jgi:cystathionine beta-lyase/cystathionine gamma-synthase
MPAADRALGALRLATDAPSLGGVETLITQPVKTSHAGMRPEDRKRIGITDDLVRISVGIEGVDDLIADFAQALEAATAPVGGRG